MRSRTSSSPTQRLDTLLPHPLLEDPARKWDRPAVMTFGRNNHAVRSERYRYIRYAAGGEEFYDHSVDPNEWTNLADDPEYADLIREHKRWLPKVNVPGALRKSSFDFDPVSYTWRRARPETDR